MLLKQSLLIKRLFKIIFVLFLLPQTSQGIQRDVKEEKESLIKQINSIVNLVEKEVEGFKGLTWNSFPEQIQNLVFMKVVENEKCYITDLNGKKLAGIGGIVNYVQTTSNNPISENTEVLILEFFK
ncbi:unnamed protein product [Meloidogyne enterolobii]|uniref:Uncharacterized protein n=1 Tax=Meloidogyne enterolobii TaxID=390850 RepID=A0ACB1A7R2_MELEN